jgi:hypothetical protein
MRLQRGTCIVRFFSQVSWYCVLVFLMYLYLFTSTNSSVTWTFIGYGLTTFCVRKHAVYVTHPAQSVVNFGAIVWVCRLATTTLNWSGTDSSVGPCVICTRVGSCALWWTRLDEFFGGAAKYHHKVYGWAIVALITPEVM